MTQAKLKHIQQGLDESELDHLDISCNKSLEREAYTVLADMVADNGLKTLKLRGCELSKQDINKFREVGGKKKAKLRELDISYNSTMNKAAFKAVGKTVKQYGVEKLGMAGCRLGKDQAQAFLETAANHQMQKMNVRDNSTIGPGVVEIGKMVNQCGLKDLDISECRLSTSQLKSFKVALGTGQLQTLNLSDSGKVINEDYILAVSDLLPNVEENLYLRLNKLDESLKKLLQDKLNSLPRKSLKITLTDDTIVWQEDANSS